MVQAKEAGSCGRGDCWTTRIKDPTSPTVYIGCSGVDWTKTSGMLQTAGRDIWCRRGRTRGGVIQPSHLFYSVPLKHGVPQGRQNLEHVDEGFPHAN